MCTKSKSIIWNHLLIRKKKNQQQHHQLLDILNIQLQIGGFSGEENICLGIKQIKVPSTAPVILKTKQIQSTS